MSLIQAPFTRQQRAGINNPRYVSDIVAANQLIQDMLAAFLGQTSFAILSGLNYVVAISGPNYYTAGFFYLNGIFYYQPATVEVGEYLAPNVTGIMPYTYSDAATSPLYQVNFSQATTNPSGATVQFSGPMNQYRYDITTILNEIAVLQTATIMAVSVVASLPANYTVSFTQDKSIFFESAPVSTAIAFNLAGAIPGTVVTLKWTFATSLNLSIPPAAGQTILLESGDQTNAGENTNILTILYAGINDLGNPDIRCTLSQPTIPS